MDEARSVDSASRSETTRGDGVMQPQEQLFPCSICFHTATKPVTSTCGHLFCWECLYMWLRGQARPSPVCRTGLIQGVNIIPIYTDDGESVGPNSSGNNAAIPQRPHPPSPGRMEGLIPLPSPVEIADGRAAAVTTDRRLLDILDDLKENYEISRERVDTLGRTVEELVRWNLQLRLKMDGMRRQYAREIDGIRRLRHHRYQG